MNIDKLIEHNWQQFKSFREHIHAHPELSFEEFETSQYIQDILHSHQIEFRVVCETGIIAEVKGNNPSSRCIALRADLDALPIQEQNEVPYKSQNDGVMHACGHDVHASILLATAILVHQNRDSLEGTVKFIFQPGEEKHPGGASLLIAENVLDSVQAIVALHVYPSLPSGTIGFREGKYMASTDEVYITIQGKGGHAALPHQTIDPIVIAAELIQGMQNIISRKKNPILPSVLTFGKISGGFAPNVIPDKVELEGTLRCLDEEWRYEAHGWIKEYGEKVANAWGAHAVVDVRIGYPSLINHTLLTKRCRSLAKKIFEEDKVKELDLRMTGEDFSFYTHIVPGCFFRLGTNKDYKEFTSPVHNAHFDIDINAMKTGIKSLVTMAMELDVNEL